MNVTKTLQFVDCLVVKKTGKHLDDLQKNIIPGLWEGKTYERMAQEIPGKYNDNYIGEVSRNLFRLLSEELNEEIKKTNFCWTLERVMNTREIDLVQSSVNNTHDRHHMTLEKEPSQLATARPKYADLAQAPKIRKFCDRTIEMNTLSDWINWKKVSLISVLGLPGIGKSTLVKQWLDLNRDNFDVVIWKDLKICSSLSIIIDETAANKNLKKDSSDYLLKQFFNLLMEQRCLIVMDDFQEVFIAGTIAGKYRPESQVYKILLQKLKEIEHQSSIILISQEQCQEMIPLDEELYPVKCLELQGLENSAILHGLGLRDRQAWDTLVQYYDGNPLYLQQIAILIKTFFAGSVSEFINENSFMLTEDMKDRMAGLFDRLSPVEQKIMKELSQASLPISRKKLRETLSLSSIDLINGLVSLKRRYLLDAKPSLCLPLMLREGMRQVISSSSKLSYETVDPDCDRDPNLISSQ